MPPAHAPIPGVLLGSTKAYVAGPGTYISGTTIYSSLAGPVLTASTEGHSGVTATQWLPVLSVMPGPMSASTSPTNPLIIPSRSITCRNRLPAVNSTVLAKITRLQTRQANVAILVVDDVVCADLFNGIIRREDIRGWEVDKVTIESSFRVGDVVRGVVISLGDQSAYYLSTAKNELGVLMAKSDDGNQMVPISWQEFRDPLTGKNETRKVAKPV